MTDQLCDYEYQQFGGAEFAGPKNDGQNRRVGKCKAWKMTDQIAVLVLENAYFYSGENSFTGALSSKFTGTKCIFSVAVKH